MMVNNESYVINTAQTQLTLKFCLFAIEKTFLL